jgi:A/G-specific adenine glycosylase
MSNGIRACQPVRHRIDQRRIRFFRQALLGWWKHQRRRKFPWREKGASRYHQIISEILLQRTRAETVAMFWNSFLHRYPNWNAIANSNPRAIEKTLRPIGLSRQRAPRIHALARIIAASGGRFPRSRPSLEALPAIGQYVANAILLFHFGQSEPLLDGTMARVLERFFGKRGFADIRYDPYLQALSHQVVSGKKAKELNWAILDLGTTVCRSNRPCIEECPLQRHCLHAAAVRHSQLPR